MSINFPKASRVQNLPPYPFVQLGQRIKELTEEGHTIIRMDMGSPDLPPPSAVIEALADSASRPDVHGYSGYRGTSDFRKATANYYKRRYGVTFHADKEVLPLLGSKEGIVNLSLATLSKGDIALIPELGYPAYTMGAQLADADSYLMPMSKANNYLPVLADIPSDVAQRAKLLWLNYPNNPTGAIAPVEYYQEAVDFCRQYDILLCSDNPYLELMYDGRTYSTSVMQIEGAKDCAVEFISMSKAFNMAGWRIGAMVGSQEIIDILLLVKSNVDSGHFIPVYHAASVALETTPQSWLDSRNLRYQNRRDMVVEALPSIGLELEDVPQGSLYVWARVPDGDDVAYAHRILEEAYVSVTPGTFFGKGGAGYIRFSLGTVEEQTSEALERMKSVQS